jgi:hypothetical protein
VGEDYEWNNRVDIPEGFFFCVQGREAGDKGRSRNKGLSVG